MHGPDELRQEIEARRDRMSKLRAASLRINVYLDFRPVLWEGVDGVGVRTGARLGGVAPLEDSGRVTTYETFLCQVWVRNEPGDYRPARAIVRTLRRRWENRESTRRTCRFRPCALIPLMPVRPVTPDR